LCLREPKLKKEKMMIVIPSAQLLQVRMLSASPHSVHEVVKSEVCTKQLIIVMLESQIISLTVYIVVRFLILCPPHFARFFQTLPRQ
jgi:hypothetical protein